MMKVGIALLSTGLLLSIITTFMFDEYANLKYIQTVSFLLGVVGLFLMERNRVKARAENRKKNRKKR